MLLNTLKTLDKKTFIEVEAMGVEEQNQIEQERLSWTIARAIRQSMDLTEILETTVSKVRHFLGCDRVIVYRFNPDWSGVVVAESVEAPWISTIDKTIADPCFQNNWVELYQQGRVKAIANIHDAKLNPCHVKLLDRFQVQANMVVPILQGSGKDWDATPEKKGQDVAIESRLWGLLIAHHCAKPRQWEQRETDLLFSLSAQVALAIQQAELYQQAQTEVSRQRRMASQLSKLNRSVRMLLECNKLLAQATEETELLRDICQVITNVGGYQLAWVGLTEQEGARGLELGTREEEDGEMGRWGDGEMGGRKNPLTLLSSQPLSTSEATEQLRIKGLAFELEDMKNPSPTESELAKEGSEFIAEAIRTSEPSLVENLKLQVAGVRQDYAVAIALPLRSEGISGALTIYSKQDNAFDVAEVELLKELAETLSHGLMTLRARNLLRQTNQRLRKEISDRKQAEAALKDSYNLLEQTKEALRQANEDLEQRVQERTAELEKTNAELLRSNTELEQFAYVASHDLREPLRKVKSYTELLAGNYKGQLDEKADKYINYITDGAVRMQTLISDLLSYSRVGRGNPKVEPTTLDAVLEQTLTDLSNTIDSTQAQITVKPMPTVQANPVQMGQLFQNLIANALKFRSEATPEIHIEAQWQTHEWLISVQDNGIGIKPQYAERIFEIFQRLHGRDKYPGTGIGLAICRKIVEYHGGRIWVESEPNQGTTFYFTLPVLCSLP